MKMALNYQQHSSQLPSQPRHYTTATKFLTASLRANIIVVVTTAVLAE